MRTVGLRVGGLLAVVAVGVCSCADGVTAPSTSSEANVIRIVDPTGALGETLALREMLAATLTRVTEQLPLSGVTVTVTADAARAIGGYGVGGFAPDARTVSIYIDPGFPEIRALWPARLPAVLAHELHHAKRWRGPGYGRTLLEAMVSEGLADRFSIELLGVAPPPWVVAFPREETSAYLDLARPEFDSTAYDHNRWFFTAGPQLPRWTGYTLGFRLVEDYLASHPGSTAAALAHTPASAFRPPS